MTSYVPAAQAEYGEQTVSRCHPATLHPGRGVRHDDVHTGQRPAGLLDDGSPDVAGGALCTNGWHADRCGEHHQEQGRRERSPNHSIVQQAPAIILSSMAALVPFRALRPMPSSAARVAAVPYDVVNAEEARALGADPLSFLHVSRAEIDLPPDTESLLRRGLCKSGDQFGSAQREGAAWSQEDVGDALCLSAEDGRPRADRRGRLLLARRLRARPHQEARADATRQGRRPHSSHAGAAARRPARCFSPIGHRPPFDAVVERIVSAAHPLFDFAAADGVRHTIWRSRRRRPRQLIGAFRAVAGALYRRRSSSRGERGARPPAASAAGDLPASGTRFSPWRFRMTRCQVLAYNRIVKDLGRHTAGVASRGAARAVRR